MAFRAPEPTYCVADIETDGPDPARHSMRSLAIVAVDDVGRELRAFAATLQPRGDATTDPTTMAWWATEPAAWHEATRDPRPAGSVMRDLATWLRSLPAPRVFVAHPLAFDGTWIDTYLARHLGTRLFDPHSSDPLFAGAGIDLGTHVRALFDLPWTERPPAYPRELRDGRPHDHTALADARGHAALLIRSRDAARDPARRERLRAELLASIASVGKGPTRTPDSAP